MTKVLVTGAAGFIGTWLVPSLRNAGYEVVGVDRVDGDISLPGGFQQLVETHKPEIVVHLSAKAGVIWCEENPDEAIRNNALSTLYVAKECQRRGMRLVFASSSEVYGDQLEGLEDGPVYPKTIYGTIKLMEEHMCKLYTVRPLILRISMPYGPFWEPLTSIRRIRHRAAIVNFLWQGVHRLPMSVHTGARRSLCYIEDVVRAIIMLMQQNRDGIWNIGRDDVYMPIRELAELACEMTGAPKDLIYEIPPPMERTLGKNLSMKKIQTIGWKPEVSLEDGMRRLLAWVKTLPSP